VTTAADRGRAHRTPGPYPGPRPFREAEAARFFGRRREARDVLSLWKSERVTVLHGPVAVGKTSLLRAGVLPLVSQERRAEVLPIGGLGHEPARSPALPPPYNSYSYALLSHWSRFSVLPALGTPLSEFLFSRVPQTGPDDEPTLLLAAIDHFEELFTVFPAREEDRKEFIGQLADALQAVPALRLLLVINDDHRLELASYEGMLTPLRLTDISLTALDRKSALEAVINPLADSGVAFGPGVPEELIRRMSTTEYRDLAGERAVLESPLIDPLLLQIVCTDLWSSLPTDVTEITFAQLRDFADVGQALARFYDAAVSAVHLETEEPEESLRAWIESTFITEHGTRGTACRGLLATAGMPNQVADALARGYVLAPEYRAHSTWYQLSHDRMVAAVRAANRAWRTTSDTTMIPPPTTPTALIAAAEAALAANNYPSARSLAEQAISLAAAEPSEVGRRRRLGYALTLRGNIAKTEGDLLTAERYLQDALAEFSALEDRDLIARTLSALADVAFDAGNYTEAERLWRDAVELIPSFVDAMIGLGNAQWYEGSPATAEATFAQALSSAQWYERPDEVMPLEPDRYAKVARASGLRGQVLAEMAEYDTALANLNPALSTVLTPEEEIDIRSARALALTGLGRYDEANRELAAARSLAPHRARTLRRAGKIAALRGERELAIEEIERALQAEPPLPPWDRADARRLRAALRGEDT
jgi:tetratricopeptide (TPR) repeat protein